MNQHLSPAHFYPRQPFGTSIGEENIRSFACQKLFLSVSNVFLWEICICKFFFSGTSGSWKFSSILHFFLNVPAAHSDIFTMFNAKLILTLMGSLSVYLLSVVDAFLTVTDIILGTPVLASLAFTPFFLLRLPFRSLTKFLFLVQ